MEGLDLGAAGIAVDAGRLRLDAYLRTTNPAVFAAGDVAGWTPSTHAADAMARRVLSNAFFLPAFRFDPDTVPRTVLTRPELASVGVQAAAPGITAVDVPYQALDRQRCEGHTAGFARLWVDRRGRIRGATFVGEGAVDLLAGVLVAMRGVRTVGGLASLVVPYPTRAEVLRKLGDAWFKARWGGWLARCIRVWLRLRLGPGSVRR
jgi:pyruvate/2-oxoglutarate dehydrogenase complex dihydrolipoamide dehydrogenase (E3) component